MIFCEKNTEKGCVYLNYKELSPEGEKLLQEIIELSNSEKDNVEYWQKRFSQLSFQEDSQLRSVFKELKDCGYINTTWADDIPWVITVTNDGKNYEFYKKEEKRKEKKLSHREWKIAIVSALIGAAVGLIPWIISLL